MDLAGGGCDNAFSFCGVRNSRYPDRKPMGFPFDRLPRGGVVLLSQFLTPNMITQNVQIRYTDRIINGPTVNNQPSTTQQPTQNRVAPNTTSSKGGQASKPNARKA